MFVKSVIISITTLLLVGCGGGGGSSDGGVPTLDTSDQVEITTQNAATIVSGSTAAASVVDSGDVINGAASRLGQNDVNLAGALDTLNALLPTFQGAAARETQTYKGTQACTYGGTVTISVTGDENEAAGTLTFNQCAESSGTLNGTMTMYENSSGLTTVTATNLTLDGNGFYYNFLYLYEKVDESKGIVSMKTTAHLKSDLNGEMSYSDFEIEVSGVNGALYMEKINGSVTELCTNQWVTISTEEAIQTQAYATCPSDGVITISGSGSSKVKTRFNADQSVDIYVNDATTPTHYNSCLDISGQCPA